MYTIKEAASRVGVGVPLLRAWERRYGVVVPERTASGYRLYDDEAIQRLTAMRRLIEDGWAAHQAGDRIRTATASELATLSATAERDLPEGATDVAVAAPDIAPRDLVARIVAAAKALDGSAFEEALDEAFGAMRFEAATERVLMPALHGIGVAWEREELSVAAEHAASQAVLRRLTKAYDAAGGEGEPHPVLVGLPPGARHEFGALAFATAARRAGLPVLYLGPDLPAESWASAAVERSARATVIGVPRRADAGRAAEVVVALRAAGPDVLVAVGGTFAGRVARASGALELPAGLTAATARLRQELEGSLSGDR